MHNLESLADLTAALARIGPRREEGLTTWQGMAAERPASAVEVYLRLQELGKASGILLRTEHPAAGPLRQARNAARFSGTPPEHRRGAPELGEHAAEILAEAGFTPDEIERLKAPAADPKP